MSPLTVSIAKGPGPARRPASRTSPLVVVTRSGSRGRPPGADRSPETVRAVDRSTCRRPGCRCRPRRSRRETAADVPQADVARRRPVALVAGQAVDGHVRTGAPRRRRWHRVGTSITRSARVSPRRDPRRRSPLRRRAPSRLPCPRSMWTRAATSPSRVSDADDRCQRPPAAGRHRRGVGRQEAGRADLVLDAGSIEARHRDVFPSARIAVGGVFGAESRVGRGPRGSPRAAWTWAAVAVVGVSARRRRRRGRRRPRACAEAEGADEGLDPGADRRVADAELALHLAQVAAGAQEALQQGELLAVEPAEPADAEVAFERGPAAPAVEPRDRQFARTDGTGRDDVVCHAHCCSTTVSLCQYRLFTLCRLRHLSKSSGGPCAGAAAGTVGSSSVHAWRARLPVRGTGVRPLGPRPAAPRVQRSEVVTSATRRWTERSRTAMSAQQRSSRRKPSAILPSALVVLMTILAMLGVIANAAIA